MPDFDYKEKRCEEDIDSYLIGRGGYIKGNQKDFDRKLALDVNTFVSFVKTSQPQAVRKQYPPLHKTAPLFPAKRKQH